jgi:MFS family permease
VIPARVRNAGNNTFRSLRVRNYRLYFEGQLISICGTWMQTIAQALLVLDLSHDNGLAAGFVIAIQFVPTLCLGALAGVFVDRFDKRTLMMWTQGLMAFNALVLATLALTGVDELWMVYAVVLANGLVTTVDLPLRQSFVSEMVGEDDLSNAVALNSAIFNSARIIGPAVAAVVLWVTNESAGACFLVNAASYFAVIYCLVLMRPAELHQPERVQRARGQVREGFAYVWAYKQVRWVVLLVGVFGTVAFNFNVSLPLMAKLVFHDKRTFSEMTVAMGIGSLLGALVTASRKEPSVPLMLIASAGFSAANLAAAASPRVSLMLPALAAMGFCSITFLSTANALVQLSVAPAIRGRVMAIYSMVLLGGTPLGNLLSGWVADVTNPRWSVAIGGFGTILGLALLGGQVRQPRVRPEDLGELIDDESVADEATVIGN